MLPLQVSVLLVYLHELLTAISGFLLSGPFAVRKGSLRNSLSSPNKGQVLGSLFLSLDHEFSSGSNKSVGT